MNGLVRITLFQWLCLIVSSFRMTSIPTNSRSLYKLAMNSNNKNDDHDILVRALKGEQVDRTPVWLMRQAGRYMADFRKYSEKYPFRMRSETPDIAIELSLQPWRTFGVDGVIMFSDILTPLPAMGVDFTIIEGKGPKILDPIRDYQSAERVKPLHDVASQVPFLSPILKVSWEHLCLLLFQYA